MGYTNSSLVAYTKLSPNHSGQRTHSIDRISPHCVVGQCTAEGLGDWFAASSTQASSNYGIDKNGRVGLYVEEKNRSWCTSSNANDQRAITIECASGTSEPYEMNDAVYTSLIKLCTDICKRNGKKKLLWFADKDKSLSYEPAFDEMLITVHRWFANKSCPGNWLYARLGDVASKVTAALGGVTDTATPTVTETSKVTSLPATPFTVNVIIDDLNYRSEPSMNGAVKGQTGKGVFTITQVSDGWGKLKSGVGWIYLENPSYVTVNGSSAPTQTNTSTPTQNASTGVSGAYSTGSEADAKKIWDYLLSKVGNEYGVAGLMGNIQAESGLKSNNLQNSYEKSLGMTDAEYTAAVDNGTYTNFIKDKAGYGLVQWTYWSLKEALYNYAKSKNKSIGDIDMQLEFICKQLSEGYSAVWNTCKNAKSVLEASNAMLLKFERPADQSEAVQNKRASYGETFYNKYAKKQASTSQTGGNDMSVNSIIETATKWMENAANDNSHGYDQIYRWGEKGDYDCSAAVITAWQNAGVPVKTNGASYTGNMLNVFKKCGFADITSSINLSTGSGLQRGDVLLNSGKHTAMYCGNGKEVEASINEKGTATGGTPGDQTGKEFLIRSYRNYPWTSVLRYTGGATVAPTTTASTENKTYCGKGVGTATALCNMNVRSGKGTSYGVYATIPKGTQVEVLETGEWFKIVWPGASCGYAYTSNQDSEYYSYKANKTATASTPATSTATTSAKKATESAQSMDKSLAGTYKTTANLNVRVGAGTNKAIMVTIPKGTSVKNYGYYTAINGTKWLYIQFTYNNVTYTGFASGAYLTK